MPAQIIPSAGQQWVAARMMDDITGEYPYIVAVGTGTSDPTSRDTSLESEVYRANDDDGNCTVKSTSDTGEIVARITVSGQDLPGAGPPDISELGLLTTDGVLLYRETRGAVEIEESENQTFRFTVVVSDG